MSMDLEDAYDKLYRYCYHRLGSREAAEDAVQEAFTRYLASGRPLGGSAAMRYLYTVARNLCTDEYRRRKPDPLPEDLPAPADEDARLEDMALRDALAKLDPDERELLLMRYVNQEPVSLMAALLGQSRFTVYRRTQAALHKLRAYMKEDEP